jgi:CheY-like chemotaxis protein
MRFGPCSDSLEDPAPPLLLSQLRTLTQWQHRADVLGVQMATLRQLIARSFILIEPDAPFDADRLELRTIAIAHDHPALQSIAAEILEGLNYRVIVTDSRMADVPGGSVIDAILLDVPLVNEERLTCIRRAKQLSSQVVVVTSIPEGSGRQRLRDAGVVGFVAWPLDCGELAACLRGVLNADLARPT